MRKIALLVTSGVLSAFLASSCSNNNKESQCPCKEKKECAANSEGKCGGCAEHKDHQQPSDSLPLDEKKAQYMRMAIDLSIKSVNEGGGPFGAVVVKDGEVVAASANRVTINNDPTAHAEVMTIRNACQKLGTFDLSGCELYTSCEPCPMCLSAMYWAHISKYYYANDQFDAAKIGFDDAFIYEELDKPIENRTLKRVQMLRDEALEAFKQWASKGDKTEY